MPNQWSAIFLCFFHEGRRSFLSKEAWDPVLYNGLGVIARKLAKDMHSSAAAQLQEKSTIMIWAEHCLDASQHPSPAPVSSQCVTSERHNAAIILVKLPCSTQDSLVTHSTTGCQICLQHAKATNAMYLPRKRYNSMVRQAEEPNASLQAANIRQ